MPLQLPRPQFRLSSLLWLTMAVACWFGGIRAERWKTKPRYPILIPQGTGFAGLMTFELREAIAQLCATRNKAADTGDKGVRLRLKIDQALDKLEEAQMEAWEAWPIPDDACNRASPPTCPPTD